MRRNALLAILVLSPLFALFIPKMIYITFLSLLAPVAPADALTALIFYIAVELLIIFSIFVCLNNATKISQEGIEFPLRFMLQTGWRRKRLWSEIRRVEFLHADYTPYEVVFDTHDGLPISYRLSSLPNSDLQNLLLGLNTYGTSVPIEPPLEELQLAEIKKHLALPETSYTEIWEQGMNTRFGTTIFVPKEPGEKVRGGTLTVVEQLAYGGFSAVYLVKRDRSEMVLKEFVVPESASPIHREKATELFQREANFLCRLNHPSIVKVHDHFVEEGQHYLLLEHIRGLTLRRLVAEQGVRSERIALTLAAEILDILIYLHGQSPPLVHRDLTPDNLILAHDGKVRLIDFGAANTFLGTATGTLVGKQSYIAPEQFRGKAVPQSDLYSLGCTLYFLLTGTDAAPLSVSDPASKNSDLSADICSLVTGLTALETQQRFKDAVDVRAQVEELLQSRALSV